MGLKIALVAAYFICAALCLRKRELRRRAILALAGGAVALLIPAEYYMEYQGFVYPPCK